MIFSNLSLFVIILFAIFGAVMFSTILHEYSHKADFSEISIDGEICLFVVPQNITLSNLFVGAIAYYNPIVPIKYKEEHAKISKYTEYKAYFISFIVLIFFLTAYVIVLRRWFKNAIELKEMSSLREENEVQH